MFKKNVKKKEEINKISRKEEIAICTLHMESNKKRRLKQSESAQRILASGKQTEAIHFCPMCRRKLDD